jgi:uncharacterized membrane protein
MRKTPNPLILRLAALLLALTLLLSSALPAAAANPAANPAVHAVLFYSPTCGHCHTVMTVHLPPLKEQYGSRLVILEVNVQTDEGRRLFEEVLEKFSISRAGVPLMVIGDTYLMGSVDIPGLLPGLIEEALPEGGIPWPDLPGLPELVAGLETGQEVKVALPAVQVAVSPEQPIQAVQVAASQEQPLPASVLPDDGELTLTERWMNNFRSDIAGNSIAVVTLVGMVFVLGMIGVSFVTADDEPRLRGLPNLRWPSWTIPALAILGLGVAGYLSYVELTGVQAVCGPVGKCNAVQDSPYSKLWGILPVGVLGLAGYVGILAAWLVQYRSGSPILVKYGALALWGMALIGVLFSAYLTFLEPFVIGATCAWCITSAVLITLILWVATPPALKALED